MPAHDATTCIGRPAARDAAVRVGDRLLWHDVNVDVPAGQFVAILGPNGVGKSTLIKAVLGVIPLAAGEAFVFGQPAGTANREIGYLPQRRSFDPSLRVRGIDVVRLGLDGDHFGLPLPWSCEEPRSADAGCATSSSALTRRHSHCGRSASSPAESSSGC